MISRAPVELIIEEHIKNNLQAHLDAHNIIDKNHHGSWKGHGTNTAMTQITHECNTRYENNTYTTILQTDLCSAFDTVDTFRLLQKLQYYGFE